MEQEKLEKEPKEKIDEEKEPTRLKYVIPNLRSLTTKVRVVRVPNPVEITSKKTFNMFNLQNLDVTDASIEPDTRMLVLWGENIGKYKVGDVLTINNAYTVSWQDKPQIRLKKQSTVTVG